MVSVACGITVKISISWLCFLMFHFVIRYRCGLVRAMAFLMMLAVTPSSALAFEIRLYDPPGPPVISKVRVHKEQRRMELLAGTEVVRSYRISLGRNPVGHKLSEGDSRTPEGLYTLDLRNKSSDYFRSIRISYPNERDRSLASAWGLDPGGDIMIHGLPNGTGDLDFAYAGLDWTEGCIAVTNEEMEEIWELVDVGTPILILP